MTATECPLCGDEPHTDWRADPLGGNHRDTTGGLLGPEVGDAEVNDYLARVRNTGAHQSAEDLS